MARKKTFKGAVIEGKFFAAAKFTKSFRKKIEKQM